MTIKFNYIIHYKRKYYGYQKSPSLLRKFLPLIFLAPLHASLIHPDSVDFGVVQMGVTAQGNIQLDNSGNTTIKIERVNTSCGCTAITLAPNARLIVPYTIDTTQKLGQISKNVRFYLEGQTNPAIVTVKGIVIPPTMNHNATSAKGQSIFSPQCALCHVQPGENKFGLELLLADCATCHGTNRTGGSAPTLLGEPKPHWRSVITEGKGSMPGFSTAFNGPLTPAQLNSLVHFLEGKTPIPPTRGGHDVYVQTCAVCHGSARMGGIGPSLQKLPPNDKLRSLLGDGSPHFLMPSFLRAKGGVLSEEEIENVVNYLAP